MAYLLYFIGVASRLIPHGANFTPVGAIGIFSAKKLSKLKAAIIVIAIMLTSDIFLGYSRVSPYVYAGFLCYILASYLIGKKLVGYLVAPIAGSLMFFIVSNFGVWLGPWYSHDLSGLSSCFIAAIPFYRNTVIGDIIFTVAVFSLYRLYEILKAKYFKEVKWERVSVAMSSKTKS